MKKNAKEKDWNFILFISLKVNSHENECVTLNQYEINDVVVC